MQKCILWLSDDLREGSRDSMDNDYSVEKENSSETLSLYNSNSSSNLSVIFFEIFE